MALDSGRPLASLKVDGGASQNDLLMQFQADVLGVRIVRPASVETTAFGAAFLAGLGAGVWRSKDDIARAWKQDREFAPNPDRSTVTELLGRWDTAVGKA
jgi:glycerol kinase